MAYKADFRPHQLLQQGQWDWAAEPAGPRSQPESPPLAPPLAPPVAPPQSLESCASGSS